MRPPKNETRYVRMNNKYSINWNMRILSRAFCLRFFNQEFMKFNFISRNKFDKRKRDRISIPSSRKGSRGDGLNFTLLPPSYYPFLQPSVYLQRDLRETRHRAGRKQEEKDGGGREGEVRLRMHIERHPNVRTYSGPNNTTFVLSRRTTSGNLRATGFPRAGRGNRPMNGIEWKTRATVFPISQA